MNSFTTTIYTVYLSSALTVGSYRSPLLPPSSYYCPLLPSSPTVSLPNAVKKLKGSSFNKFNNRFNEFNSRFNKFNNGSNNARRAGNEDLGVKLYIGSLLFKGSDELSYNGYK